MIDHLINLYLPPLMVCSVLYAAFCALMDREPQIGDFLPYVALAAVAVLLWREVIG